MLNVPVAVDMPLLGALGRFVIAAPIMFVPLLSLIVCLKAWAARRRATSPCAVRGGGILATFVCSCVALCLALTGLAVLAGIVLSYQAFVAMGAGSLLFGAFPMFVLSRDFVDQCRLAFPRDGGWKPEPRWAVFVGRAFYVGMCMCLSAVLLS